MTTIAGNTINPIAVEPLPNEFLRLPLPDTQEGTLREAFELIAEVADAFGASTKAANRIYRLRDQAHKYLPYAPLASAILEGAYRGEETIAPEHVSRVLNAQHKGLPWQTRD